MVIKKCYVTSRNSGCKRKCLSSWKLEEFRDSYGEILLFKDVFSADVAVDDWVLPKGPETAFNL